MSKVERGMVVAVFFGFSAVGILLLTNHWGFAVKISNYTFALLVAIVIYEIFKK